MKFLLTKLKIFYVLDPSLNSLPDPTPKDVDAVKVERKKVRRTNLSIEGTF
jgi:hypothetical protein